MQKLIFSFFIAFISLSTSASAQTWEVGGMVGASGYIGDFNPTNPIKFTDAAGGLFLKRNFNGYLSAKVGYVHGNIQGNDANSSNAQLVNRNLNFRSNLDEVSLTGELNFIRFIPEVGSNKFTPFIYAGIGRVGYDPKTTYNGNEYELRPLMTENNSYSDHALAIPYGVGVKYNFSGKWNLILDLGYRSTNTPYLDDVYAYYPYPSTLQSDIARALSDRSATLNIPGSQRGNFRNSDTYMVVGFSISYTFVPINCPRF